MERFGVKTPGFPPPLRLASGIGPAGALKKTGMAPGVSVKVFRDFKESVLVYAGAGRKVSENGGEGSG